MLSSTLTTPSSIYKIILLLNEQSLILIRMRMRVKEFNSLKLEMNRGMRKAGSLMSF